MPSLRPSASSDQKQAKIDKGKEIFEKKTVAYLVRTCAGSR